MWLAEETRKEKKLLWGGINKMVNIRQEFTKGRLWWERRDHSIHSISGSVTQGGKNGEWEGRLPTNPSMTVWAVECGKCV